MSSAAGAAAGATRGAGGASSAAGATTGAGGASTNSAGGTPAFAGGSGAGGVPLTGSGGASGGGAGTSGVDAGSIGPSACHTGHYVGTLTGNYTASALLLPAPLALNAPIDLNLSTGNTPGFVDLDATVSGVYNFAFVAVPYSAHITGRIDCKTGQIVGGRIDGVYTVPSGPGGRGGSGGSAGSSSLTFTGPFTGGYVSNGTFSGTWTGQESNPSYGGNGTWTASLR